MSRKSGGGGKGKRNSANSGKFVESGGPGHRQLEGLVAARDVLVAPAPEAVAVDDGEVDAVAGGGVAAHGGVEAADGEVGGLLDGDARLDAVLQHAVGEGRAGARQRPRVLDGAARGVHGVDAAP